MKIRKNCKYAVACVSSMGLRITPENRMAVHNSNRFLLQATSAETNVLNVTSSLGPECLVLTRFVAGSPMQTTTVLVRWLFLVTLKQSMKLVRN